MHARYLLTVFSLMLALVSLPVTASAKDLGPCSVPDTMQAGENRLILNGVGFRTKFYIKIYACPLYLIKRQSDANTIINADEPMALGMYFVHDVGRTDMTKALEEGFRKATNGNTAPIRKQIDSIYSGITGPIKEGDCLDLIYVPENGVTLYYNGKKKGVSTGIAFKRALFAIWLGDKPIGKSLKNSMLGK